MYLTNFFSEDKAFDVKGKKNIRELIKKICVEENKKLGFINCVFCSDNYLIEINNKYLQHDYFTDIITFDHSENKKNIEGDLYISIDRTKENAKKYNVDENTELISEIIHGILHLIGYKEKKKKEKTLMSEKENKYLSLYKQK